MGNKLIGLHPLILKHKKFDHLCATRSNLSEYENALGQLGYQAEGVACFVFADQRPGTVPLFRLFNSALIDHFYTRNATERDSATRVGWRYEIIACYVFGEQVGGTVPLYRLHTPDHAAQITSFAANPSYINPGQRVVLSWAIKSYYPVYQLRLQGTDAQGHSVLDIHPSAFNVEVNPQNTTTYRLTATDCLGSDTQEVVVTVYQPQPTGVAKVVITNCMHETVSIWIRDLTGGTGYVRQGTLASQYDESGHCPAAGSRPFVLTLQPGHQYEIVAVNLRLLAQRDQALAVGFIDVA